MTKSNKMSQTHKKIDFRMEPKFRPLPYIPFVAVAFQSGEVLRKSVPSYLYPSPLADLAENY